MRIFKVIILLIIFPIDSCLPKNSDHNLLADKRQNFQINLLANKRQNFQINFKEYTLKPSGFLIILDSSISMSDTYRGKDRLEISIDIIDKLKDLFPDEIIGGLRIIGDADCLACSKTKLIYGMEKFNKYLFMKALKKIREPGGLTPMYLAINKAIYDFKKIPGKLVLIVISDWQEISPPLIESFKQIKNIYNKRLTIFNILSGEDKSGRKNIEILTDTLDDKSIISLKYNENINHIKTVIKNIFYTKIEDKNKVKDKDKDKDKVKVKVKNKDKVKEDKDRLSKNIYSCIDNSEKALNNNKELQFDSDNNNKKLIFHSDNNKELKFHSDNNNNNNNNNTEIQIDSDRDGLIDSIDKCPNTPEGADIDTNGCWILQELFFKKGESSIQNQFYPYLDSIVDILKTNTNLCVEIQGHTDNTGYEYSNIILSENRAQSVMAYFLSKGIWQKRLKAVGYGSKKPVASNKSFKGKALNRRIELKPILCNKITGY